jgi:hypothetical protein
MTGAAIEAVVGAVDTDRAMVLIGALGFTGVEAVVGAVDTDRARVLIGALGFTGVEAVVGEVDTDGARVLIGALGFTGVETAPTATTEVVSAMLLNSTSRRRTDAYEEASLLDGKGEIESRNSAYTEVGCSIGLDVQFTVY